MKEFSNRLNETDNIVIRQRNHRMKGIYTRLLSCLEESEILDEYEFEDIENTIRSIDHLQKEIEMLKIERDTYRYTLELLSGKPSGYFTSSANYLALKLVNGEKIEDLIDWTKLPVINEYVDGDGRYMDIIYKKDLDRVVAEAKKGC